MNEYAWLDLYGGIWLLLTGKTDEKARKWVDKNVALAELREEGWTITGPHPKRLSIKQDPRKRIYGYAMTRTVH
jgi:hypothetical protein